jgi:5-methyltetrahydropteroyltriglutamate--homocysteine methyltransferase
VPVEPDGRASGFNDIIPSIAAMDAFALSGEAYPVEIGPGIWDIHSARVLDANEMNELLALTRHRLEDWQIWLTCSPP